MRCPTRSAAAAPASTAARTAATSPPNITVTRPASARSLPSSRTSAAFSPASAASIAPTRPFVSTRPRALSVQDTSGRVARRALWKNGLEVVVRARDHVHRDELSHALGGRGARVGCRLHGADIAPYHDGDVAPADLFLADESHVRRLHHRVRRFNRSHETLRLDEPERILGHHSSVVVASTSRRVAA